MGFESEVGELTVIGRSGYRISLEWSISDFLYMDRKNFAYYESPLFNFYDAQWYFKIYPKQSYEGLLLIRCDLVPLSTTFNAMLGVRGADGVENREEGSLTEHGKNGEDAFCWNEFCTRPEFAQWKSRLIPENKLIISLDLKSSKEGGEEEVLKCLKKLLAGSEHSDVIIKIQGKEFPAHRAILQARSPVLKAMFNHDMVEKQSKVVTLEDSDPESFPAFLEHVYTGSIEMISVRNVFSLFTTADYFDMRILKEACTKFIKNNLTVSCFCDAITLAMKHNEEELIECVTEFFSSNISEILKTVEWQMFMKENTNVGNELLIKGVGKLKEELSLLKNKSPINCCVYMCQE